MVRVFIVKCPVCKKELPTVSNAEVIVHCLKKGKKDEVQRILKSCCAVVGELEVPDDYIMSLWEDEASKEKGIAKRKDRRDGLKNGN